MDSFFGSMYTSYVKVMSKLGGKVRMGDKPSDHENDDVAKHAAQSLDELDKEASRLGNAYRGIGVTIAFLGALIIFSAIGPTALDLHGGLYLAFGITEVIAMILVIVLIWHVKKSRLDKSWRDTRRAAEKMRYEDLFQQLVQSEHSSGPSEIENLYQETLSHLEGDWGQISYNESKAKTYHNIETVSTNLGWLGFIAALAGAVGHLLSHENWLLLLTVFVPALVGSLHALNSFLKLDDLKDDHEKMAEQLAKLKSSLESYELVPENAQSIREVAKVVYETLVDRDERWVEMAERQNLQA